MTINGWSVGFTKPISNYEILTDFQHKYELRHVSAGLASVSFCKKQEFTKIALLAISLARTYIYE